MNITDGIAAGAAVTLVPLRAGHAGALADVGLDRSLWEFTPSAVRTRGEMAAYVAAALREKESGQSLPFVIIESQGGTIVGSTRFGNIVEVHRRLEIGWTWLAPRWQRTAINTETKFLLLRHAFEVMGANRVELKTDALNVKSRRAILRIGAREEGVLREHMLTSSGRLRDTVYFSILRSEWEEVSMRLRRLIEK
jgi:RimJ/RimL family protein N-acetyltransferase